MPRSCNAYGPWRGPRTGFERCDGRPLSDHGSESRRWDISGVGFRSGRRLVRYRERFERENRLATGTLSPGVWATPKTPKEKRHDERCRTIDGPRALLGRADRG